MMRALNIDAVVSKRYIFEICLTYVNIFGIRNFKAVRYDDRNEKVSIASSVHGNLNLDDWKCCRARLRGS